MASLIEQMQNLQKQQAILAEKIKEEEERNKKLAQDASIERLEALIEPITHYLDWIQPNQNGVSYNNNSRSDRSYRHNLNCKFDLKMRQISDPRRRPEIKYNNSHILANEEIFVTLLGIIKKQEDRIAQLESVLQSDTGN